MLGNLEFKEKQKQNYDCHHRVRQADSLPVDSPVWVTTGNRQIPGRVISNASAPRSYLVTTSSGPVRRNRRYLHERLNNTDDNASDILDDYATDTTTLNAEPERDRIMTRTQTGTTIGSRTRGALGARD